MQGLVLAAWIAAVELLIGYGGAAAARGSPGCPALQGGALMMNLASTAPPDQQPRAETSQQHQEVMMAAWANRWALNLAHVLRAPTGTN